MRRVKRHGVVLDEKGNIGDRQNMYLLCNYATWVEFTRVKKRADTMVCPCTAPKSFL